VTEADVISLLREAILTTLLAAGPALAAALLIGVSVALFQALTSVQEMTLTFVPKVLGIVGVTILTLPFLFHTIADFARRLFDLIAVGGP